MEPVSVVLEPAQTLVVPVIVGRGFTVTVLTLLIVVHPATVIFTL